MESFCHWYEQLAQQQQTVDESSKQWASVWRFASRMRRELENYGQAVANARRACQYDPNDYASHYELAIALLGNQQFEQARTALTWCRQRKPNDKQLQRLFKKAIAGSGVLGETTAAARQSGQSCPSKVTIGP